jgi:hypothetical protein
VKAFAICALSAASLFFGFYGNSWGVADHEWFLKHARHDESMILGRLVKSRQDGVFSDGGLVGFGGLEDSPPQWADEPFDFQYTAYFEGLTFASYWTYDSQPGGQGILYSILDRLIPISPRDKLPLFHAFNSLLSALAVSAVVLWFYLEFGAATGLVVFASALISRYLVVFGQNLFFPLWAFYLPMAAVMYYLRRTGASLNGRSIALAGVVFVTIFVNCLFNGYAFITTALAMAMSPIVYYCSRAQASVRQVLRALFAAGLGFGIAVVCSLAVLCVQIASTKGSFMDGIDHIVLSLQKRTIPNSQEFPTEYDASFDSVSAASVVVDYLKSTFFDGNNYVSISNHFIKWQIVRVRYANVIVLFAIASWLLYSRGKRKASETGRLRDRALIHATWFSILAPLSWFVVFKAHSYEHLGMIEIVWHMPFTFFGFAVFGAVVQKIVVDRFRRETIAKPQNP